MATYRVQRIYSKFDDFNDKFTRFNHKYPWLVGGIDNEVWERAEKERLERLKRDKENGKAPTKGHIIRSTLGGTAFLGMGGALLGSAVSKGNKNAAAAGAILGGAAGAALGYKAGNRRFDAKSERALDNMKVAEGDMTEAEFNRKWKKSKK